MSVTPPSYRQGPYGGSSPESPGKPALASPMAIATELWALIILAQCVVFGGQYQVAFDAADEVSRDMPEGDLPDGAIWAVYVIVGLTLAAVFGVLAWLARSGRNWARLLLGFVSFYLVVQTVSAFFIEDADHWTMIPTVIGGVAALGAGVLLMHRDSDKYCKDMAAWRKSQSGKDGQPPWSPGPPSQYPPNPDHPNSYQQYPYQPYPQQQYPQQPYPQQQYYGAPGHQQGGYQHPAGPDNGTPSEPGTTDPRRSDGPGSDTGERE